MLTALTSLWPHLCRVVCLLLFSLAMSVTGPVTAPAEAQEQNRSGTDESAPENPAAIEKFAVGARVGWSDQRNEEYFRKYEAFFNWYLPWAWRPESGWILASRLDFTGAAVRGAGTVGFLGSVGPSLAVRKTGWPIMVELGVSPAFLSEDIYGNEDLSGHFQFLSHGGILLLPLPYLGIGYQFQHMSNADIQQPNPGLNTHSLEINFRF